MNTNAKIATAVVIVALLAAIPLTIQHQTINRLNEQLAQKAKGVSMPISQRTPTVAFASSANVQVAPPSLPPVPASEPDTATAAAEAQYQAFTNNLRQLSNAAQQFMLDHNATQATYTDLVGTDSRKYIRSINPVRSEDYQDFILYQAQTQVTQVAPNGSIVTYNL